MAALTAERLRELLHYDPLTGVFTRLVAANGYPVGSVAGTQVKRQGRVKVTIKGEQFLAHRLAWFWMTGEWPVNLVDHKDTDPSNNRWLNLRDVTQTINMQNLRAPHKGSTSGLLGVSWDEATQSWAARIKLPNGGPCRGLGYFDDKHEAHAVYLAAKREHHEGCTI